MYTFAGPSDTFKIPLSVQSLHCGTQRPRVNPGFPSHPPMLPAPPNRICSARNSRSHLNSSNVSGLATCLPPAPPARSSCGHALEGSQASNAPSFKHDAEVMNRPCPNVLTEGPGDGQNGVTLGDKSGSDKSRSELAVRLLGLPLKL